MIINVQQCSNVHDHTVFHILWFVMVYHIVQWVKMKKVVRIDTEYLVLVCLSAETVMIVYTHLSYVMASQTVEYEVMMRSCVVHLNVQRVVNV